MDGLHQYYSVTQAAGMFLSPEQHTKLSTAIHQCAVNYGYLADKVDHAGPPTLNPADNIRPIKWGMD